MPSKFELKDFSVQPCKSRLAFEFIPKHARQLKLEQTAGQLQKNGVQVEVTTPFLLMLHVAGHGVSLFKSGKIIVKDTPNQKEAQQIAEKIVSHL